MSKRTRHGRTRERRKVRFVDGFAIRNVYPDLDVIEEFSSWLSRGSSAPRPFIPEDEVWIDRRFKKEARFLRTIHRAERRLQHLTELEMRDAIRVRFAKGGNIPSFVLRSEKRGRLLVRFVRGEIVRRHIDPWFIFGGHDLVYDYIPANEVWIDVRQDPREVPFTLHHELHERKSMANGMGYSRAHHLASESERVLRGKWRLPKHGRPLAMTPFRQRPGYCAAASMKIVCSHFGREYDELLLGRLCGTTAAAGTDHIGMINAAKTLGAKVLAKSGGTIADLRRLVLREHLPVIVGWNSPSDPRKRTFVPGKDKVEDHFSVIYHLSRTHVFMMDPEVEGGRRKMSIKRFLSLWWDTDTPKNVKVNRWYMAMRFDGKKF